MQFKPYRGQWLDVMPIYYEEDRDLAGRGVRNKVRRFEEMTAGYISKTCRNVEWNLSEFIPDLPAYLPELWAQSSGWAALIKKDGQYHIVSGICAAFRGQYTQYFFPDGLIVTNPYNPAINGQYTFGKDAVLLRNDTVLQGLLPIICPKTEILTESAVTLVLGLQNLRLINLIKAANDKVKNAAEQLLRKIRWGRNGIINAETPTRWSGSADVPTIETLPINGVPPNYITQIVEAIQYARATLYNDLGVQAPYNMKRESLNSAEVQADTATLRPLIDDMKKCREEFCDECKKVFGIEVKFEMLGSWSEDVIEAAAETGEDPEAAADDQSEPEQEVSDNVRTEDAE